MTRELVDDYVWKTIQTIEGKTLGVVAPRNPKDLRWWPHNLAPDSCLKPAEPDSTAPELKVGERVYVDAPEAGGFDRMIGWGIITSRPALDHNKVCVAFDDKFTHPVPRAACHRDGPQSEPLHEGDVFLGRYAYRDGPPCDAWWDGTCIHFAGAPCSGLRPDEIYNDHWYLAALAVARELGLVEAEKDEPAPEPEFVKRQVVEHGPPEALRILRLVSDPEWTGSDWAYTAEALDGSIVPVHEFASANKRDTVANLRPHAMSTANVPDAVLVAILRNKPVRVVGAPVNHEGLPYSEKLGSTESDWLLRGKRVVITSVEAITNTKGHSLATLDDETTLWPWNLELVPDA